jgi:hypothetical protein
MEELEFDHNVFTAQMREADRNLAVKFYSQPIKNDEKTAQEGRPIFDDTEMIEIRVRGDRNNVVQRPIRPEDKQRFRDQYRDYKDGKAAEASGTPLKEWPIMSASMVEELRFLGFVTVEQVAEATDSVCGRVPGLTTMKQKAKAYLEFATTTAPLERLNHELEAQRSRAEAAEASVADLAGRMATMEAQMRAAGHTLPAATPAPDFTVPASAIPVPAPVVQKNPVPAKAGLGQRLPAPPKAARR